jgi:hypothetical protein
MVDKKQVPTGVSLISALYYIGAMICIGVGLLFIFGAGKSFLSSILSQTPTFDSFGAGLFIFIEIICLVIGFLCLFIARGLQNGRSWARVLVIVSSGLGVLLELILTIKTGILSDIFNMVLDFFSDIILDLVIGGYMLFNKKVKEFFS